MVVEIKEGSMNSNYEYDKLISDARRNNKETEIWVAIMAIGIIGFLIGYFCTEIAWLLLGCVAVVIVPPLIMWRIRVFSERSKHHKIRKSAKEPVYYYEGKLMLTENDQLVYFDRLTSTIYTWPDNLPKYKVVFENDFDWFGVFEFDPNKVEYREIK